MARAVRNPRSARRCASERKPWWRRRARTRLAWNGAPFQLARPRRFSSAAASASVQVSRSRSRAAKVARSALRTLPDRSRQRGRDGLPAAAAEGDGLPAAAAEAHADRGPVAVAVERYVLDQQRQQPLAVGVRGSKAHPRARRCRAAAAARARGSRPAALPGVRSTRLPAGPPPGGCPGRRRRRGGGPARPRSAGPPAAAGGQRRRGRDLVLRRERQADPLAIDGLHD